MKNGEFIKMEAQSSTHWWYAARKELLKHSLKKLNSGRKKLMILDLASACGDNFAVCSDFGLTYGIDISPLSIAYCRKKNIKTIVQGDVQTLPFRSGEFDIILALDVFEHLHNDLSSLQEIARVLKNGGNVIFNVPACPSLFSCHDAAFQHIRRYDSEELKKKFSQANLRIRFLSHWSFFIFPIVYIARKYGSFKKAGYGEEYSDFHKQMPLIVEKILKLLSIIEVGLIKIGLSLPFGVSLFGFAQKDA